MNSIQAKYLVIDTESTGLIPGKHGLIQLACVSLGEDLEVIHSLCTDICPPEGTEIDPQALEVNGFTPERIAKGVSYNHAAAQFLAFLENEFTEEPVVVAQFYPADYAILIELIKETGAIGQRIRQKLGNSVLDTKSLVIAANTLSLKSGKTPIFPVTSLSKPGGVKDVLGVQNYQAHDAMGDVLATREVLVKLLSLLKIH